MERIDVGFLQGVDAGALADALWGTSGSPSDPAGCTADVLSKDILMVSSEDSVRVFDLSIGVGFRFAGGVVAEDVRAAFRLANTLQPGCLEIAPAGP